MEKNLDPLTSVVFEFGFTKLTCTPGKWKDYWDCRLQVGALAYPVVTGLAVPGGLTAEVAKEIVFHHLDRFSQKQYRI